MDEKLDYKKLAKEVVAENAKKDEYKDKLTEKQVAEQTAILRAIAKWNEDTKKSAEGFYKLYEKTENRRVTEEEKLEKERLAKDEVGKGNLRAFIFQETRGIRETLKAGFEVNSLTFGKMGVKLWNAFGLFGKFDVSGVVRKMDEYTKFTKERTEKNREAKMIEQLYDLYITHDKSKEAIAAWLKTRGLKEEKINDLVQTVSQLYKERLFQLQQSGVARGLGNRGTVIASVPKDYYRSSKKSKDDEGTEKRSSYSMDLGDGDDDSSRTSKRSGGGGSPKQIAILRDTHVELVRQGSVLDGLLAAQKESNAQQAEFFDEQQQEWNRTKSKDDKDGKKGPIESFLDAFKKTFMGGMFDKLGDKLMGAIGGKMADWGASLGGALTKVLSGPVGLGGVAIAGAMGVAIYSTLAPVMEKYFNNKANEELKKEYKEGGLTVQEATLGQAYGLDPTKFKNPDELFKAINEQKKKGVKANKQLAREAGRLAGAGINEKVTQATEEQTSEYGVVPGETVEEKMNRAKRAANEKIKKEEEARAANAPQTGGGGGVAVGQPIQNNNTTVIKERGNKGHIPDRLGTGG